MKNSRLLKPIQFLGLSKLFNADQRSDKIDLGVGVYKDDSGNTPIMRAVKKAEARLHNEQTSKVYTSLLGPELFRDAMRDLLLADVIAAERVATVQTPGGTGAIRQVFRVGQNDQPRLYGLDK